MSASSQARPPKEGGIYRLTFTTSESVVQELGHDNTKEGHYWTFSCDTACFLTFGGGATVTTPVPATATAAGSVATAAAAHTYPLPADTDKEWWIEGDAERYFKVIGSAGGILTWYQS